MLIYYMKKKCKISIKNHKIITSLKNTETARIIWEKLPLKSKVNTWGSEVYFYVNFHSEIEDEAKEIIDFGEIAYWPIGKAIAIGFGKTPISKKNEIRLADKCNIWGKTSYDLKKLKDVVPGDEVIIERY